MQPGPPPHCVAILDAEDRVAERLTAELAAAGFATAVPQLADFADSRALFETMQARGVEAVVYELGAQYRTHPDRFRDLYSEIREQGMPLTVTSMQRWLREGATAEEHGVADGGSSTIERLVRGLRRQLAIRS